MKNYKLNYLLALSILAFGFFLCTACNSTDSDEDSLPPSVEGIWQSDVVSSPEGDAILRLNLDQSGTRISGMVEVEFLQDSVNNLQFPIARGNYNPPDLTLTIESDGDDPDATLNCIVRNVKIMECEVPLGDEPVDIELSKQ